MNAYWVYVYVHKYYFRCQQYIPEDTIQNMGTHGSRTGLSKMEAHCKKQENFVYKDEWEVKNDNEKEDSTTSCTVGCNA